MSRAALGTGKRDSAACVNCMYRDECRHVVYLRGAGADLAARVCSSYVRDTPQNRKAAEEREIERAFEDE